MRIEVPVPQSPIAFSDGTVRPEWRSFFTRLGQSVRSETGSLDEVESLATTPAYESAVSELAQRVSQLESIIPAVDAHQQDIADLGALIVPPTDVNSIASLPASSTDNAVARFDGTTGKKLQNSSFLVDDSGHVSSFGGNIKFPASQSVSADVNTLDDYEEVNPAAALSIGDGTDNYTISSQVCELTKIGRVVMGRVVVNWSSIGSAGATQLRIGGLPYTAASGAHPAVFGSVDGLDLTATLNPITCYVSGTSIFFERVNDNAAPTVLASNSSSATGGVSITVVYRV